MSNGLRVFNICFPLINEFLGNKNKVLERDFFYTSRRRNSEISFQIYLKYKKIYEILKKEAPKDFKYNKNYLSFLIDYIIQTKQKKILYNLVIPIQYRNFYEETDEKIFLFYLKKFSSLTKENKIKKFEEFIIKNDNWEDVIKMLEKYINFKYLDSQEGKKNDKNYIFCEYLKKNIYAFKAKKFLKNYEKYLNDYEKKN
jgi:hypothetical protein